MQYLRYEVVLYTAELADTKRTNPTTERKAALLTVSQSPQLITNKVGELTDCWDCE